MDNEKQKKWIEIGAPGSYPEGEPILKTLGDEDILILRSGEAMYAFENRCPHMGRPLQASKIKGAGVECKWHNMIFSLKDGKIIFDSGFMGIPDLKIYEVKVEGNMAYIALKT